MAKARVRNTTGCEIDMTPMIDVVFQLIIFFIVAITLTKTFNEEIKLADAPDGKIIQDVPPQTVIIEVDKSGRLTMQSVPLSYTKFRQIMQSQYNRIGQFPVMIRADGRTRHEDVRAVMDACSEVGIWRVSFVAIQEKLKKSA